MEPKPTSLFTDPFVRISIVGVCAILALFLLTKTWAGIETTIRPNASGATIMVSGTGKISSPPTIAEVVLTVDERAKTQTTAQSQATAKTDVALAALKALGVAEKDIQTQGYSVSPQYETPDCREGAPCSQSNTITGYQVTQTITVKVRETSKTGDVLKALTDAGVQNVSGPNFRIDDPTEVEATARAEAIADAHEKAEVLARQLGVRLGKVVSFSENRGGFPVFETMMAKTVGIGGAVEPAISIPQGQTETSVTVSITYEIR